MMDAETLSSLEMIRDSARGIASRGDLSRIRKLRYTTPGFDRAVWADMCAMGWPALRLPEDRGGVGLGMQAYCALAEELGHGLVPEPLIPAVLAAQLLDDAALDGHLTGARLVIPAWADARDTLGPQGPLAVAGGRVTGRKLYVPMAAGADAFLVLGSTGAMLVDADAPGVGIETFETQDGGHFATLTLDAAHGTPIAADPTPALAEATLATAAYMLGMMDAALDMTVVYLKTRVQFGKAIGSFQILQHMAVDLKLEIELTRASVWNTARLWDEQGDTRATRAAVSRSKARASAAALKVGRDCIQLHGGIGFTDEHDIGLYLRKAIVTATQFGSAGRHRANFARLMPLKEEA